MEILIFFIFFMIFLSFGIFLLLVFFNEKERRRLEIEKLNLIRRIEELEVSFQQRLNFEIEKYKKQDRKILEEELKEKLRKDYEVMLEDWKREEEKAIIEKTLKDYGSYITKKVGERIAPFYTFYKYNIDPLDIRFIGCPIDYIAFKGLESKDYNNLEVYFISVKTSKNKRFPNEKESAIKKAVEEKKVKWLEVDMTQFLDKILNIEEFEREEIKKLNEENSKIKENG
ncbi:MAG: hypothetical protein DSY60_02795 [Persephonella sp.]|nr:MAG: hypothetical protein DSY60_02795 [Persephonella sp.]